MRVFCSVLLFLISGLAISQHATQDQASSDQPTPAVQEMYNLLLSKIGSGEKRTIDSLANAMHALAKQENDLPGIANSLNITAMLAEYNGEYERADSLLKESLTIYQAYDDFENLSLTYSELSGKERKKGNLEMAFEYAQKGRALLPKVKTSQPQIFNSNILSLAFRVAGQLDSAIYYELDVIDKLAPTDSSGMGMAYSNLASSFGNIGNPLKQKEYLDIALGYSKKLVSTKALILDKLSFYALNYGNVDAALKYAEEALPLYQQSKIATNRGAGYLAMSKVYLKKGEIKTAKVYLDSIAPHLKKVDNVFQSNYLLTQLEVHTHLSAVTFDKEDLANLKKAVFKINQLEYYIRYYGLLNQYYRKQGEYQEAEECLQRKLRYANKLANAQNIQTVNNLEERYQNEQRELQIENLELLNSKQKLGLISGGIALALISLLSFFLFNIYKKVNRQKAIISKALTEKDILLREIHHRVKNNLQLVSSLLTLQGRSIDDETAIQAINEGKSRVRSMALIHQDLYNRDKLTGIGVKNYLEKLTQELFDTYRIDQDRIQLELNIQDLELDVDTLVPLGLIINELITNCLKYAFPDDNSGRLLVTLKKVADNLHLQVSDNGIGYDPENVRENSFGTTLIAALSEQLGGEVTTTSNNGTTTAILFSDYPVS